MNRIRFYTGTLDNLSSSGSGGVQFVLTKVSSFLISKFNVDIISCYKGDVKSCFDVDANVSMIYLQDRIKHSPESCSIFKAFFWILITPFAIYEILRKRDSIHVSTTPYMSLLLLFLGLFVNLKLVLWENVAFDAYSGLVQKVRCKLYKLANVIVVPSLSDKDHLERIGFNNVLQIRNPGSDLLSTAKTFSDKTISFLAAGRLVQQKGFDLLLQSVSLFQRNYNIPFRLTILGDGPDKENMINIIKDLDLADCVELKGFVSDIQSFYEINDIFLLTSRFEGLPIVLIDSQAKGLPCVAFDCPTGPSEVILNGHNGFLVRCFDVQEYADKLREICLDKDLYFKMSSNARNIAKEFSSEIICNQWVELIESIH